MAGIAVHVHAQVSICLPVLWISFTWNFALSSQAFHELHSTVLDF